MMPISNHATARAALPDLPAFTLNARKPLSSACQNDMAKRFSAETVATGHRKV
jgi:hypothetical protein